MKKFELEDKCKEVRRMIIQMAHDSKSSHVSSCLSCVEILVVLFWDIMTEEDRFILSKGHAAMAYYATLEQKGYIAKELIKSYLKNGSPLSEHPMANHNLKIDVSTGSLGHGLSLSLGAALGRKINNKRGYEFCLLGDGECNEGQIWEAALFAANNKVDNLIAIVDCNNMQAAGFVDYNCIGKKFRSFGWHVVFSNGHNINDLKNDIRNAVIINSQPSVVIANTIKGKGISFMENNLEWHYRCPNDEELSKALKEIGD